MAYDDDDLGTLFPTRKGVATGRANERQMLDSVQGAAGIRTKLRINPDGSTTRLKTRAGMPEFVTEPIESESSEELAPLFLESGHTELPTASSLATYYGLSSGRGKWWFETATDAHWLGNIDSSEGGQDYAANVNTMGRLGDTPAFAPGLYNGMISPATSIPEDKANDPDWIDAMLKKRKAMVGCPASMFSGKMRLFMQARYGRLLSTKQSESGYYEIEADGEFGVRVDGIALGNLGDVGTGIITTADNRYFLVRVSGTSASVYKISAVSKHKALVSDLRTKLASGVSADEREQIESYIFAASRIDPNPYATYPAAFPVASPLVYGWSFNWQGNKADIISVTVDGYGLDTHFASTHYSVSITHSGTVGYDVFTFAATTVSHQHWRDWRGSDNIFVPDYGSGGRMAYFSLNISYTYAGEGKFHCFYQKDGTLVTASYKQNAGNVLPAWHETDATWPGAGGNQESINYINSYTVQGRRLVTSKIWNNYSSGTAQFTVGGNTYGGAYQVGTCHTIEKYHGMGCDAPSQTRLMSEFYVSITAYGCGKPISGWNGYCQIYIDEPYVNKSSFFTWTEEDLGTITDTHTENETRVFYAAVIPFFDCCSIFVYSRDASFRGNVSIVRTHETDYNYTTGSMAMNNITYVHPFTGEVLCSHGSLIGNDTFFGNRVSYSTETFARDLGPPLYTVGVNHFHGSFSTAATEPETTLIRFFYVSQDYPYVDAQIWTSVNAGGSSAKGVVYNPDQHRRWTGWV